MYAEQLDRIQRILGDAFRQFTPIGERVEIADDVKSIVRGNDRLTPLQQAEIYREQFWLRHRDALYEDYPGMVYILGEDPFETFVRSYLLACPPDSWTLRDLGNRIATHAAEYDGFPADRADLVRDMATFELAFIDIWDGAGRDPIALTAVEAIPPEKWISARMTFHPLLTLLALSHPVHTLRTEIRGDGYPVVADVPKEPTFIALWRGEDERVHYRGIDAAQDALVRSLRDGDTLGAACEHAATRTDEPETLGANLGGWFRGWAKRGWIVVVVTD